MVIISFIGDYRFLSNYHLVKIKYKGFEFPSTENAFQASKDPSRMSEFVNLTPLESRLLGQKVDLREDWNDIKYKVMEEILNIKFKDNFLYTELIKTYPRYLVEGNYWHDNYWGACYCKSCKGVGENNLGTIIMKIRDRGIIV